MARVRITGIAKTRAALNRKLNEIKGDIRKGLIKVGFVIKAASIRNSPIDTSNLRASHYVYWNGGQFDIPSYTQGDTKLLQEAGNQEAAKAQSEVRPFMVRVGASAHYALFVHEGNPSLNWNSGGPKFLQRAIADNESNILQIVAREARI